ncbi:hypothetical protein BJ875DRAFT_437325 [Amylocarpus encephaloides]|uniref:Uncharacterized protein n=1 Tax=Amylocarpus encephaloides TaxID=45428 RepID=A0A9P8C9K0_9HELO|nr:hypothetical protein BJ875DRAFT_437325 [Amylocarpus encephaloides]
MTSMPNHSSTLAPVTITSSASSAITLPSEMAPVHEHLLSSAAKGGVFAGTFCGFVLIGFAFWFRQRHAKRSSKWPAPVGIGEAEPVEKPTGVDLKCPDTVTQIIGSNGRIQDGIAELDAGGQESQELESRAVSVCEKAAAGEDSAEDTIQDQYFERLISGNGNDNGSQIAPTGGVTNAAVREDAGQKMGAAEAVEKK